MLLPSLGTSLKTQPRWENRVLALATIHEQQFPLPDYCIVGDVPTFSSAVQTYDWLREEGQNCIEWMVSFDDHSKNCRATKFTISLPQQISFSPKWHLTE